jgi:hypothetical protein
MSNEIKLAAQIRIAQRRERERGRERENGAPKSNVLASVSPVANPKSGPDYLVLIIKQYIYLFFKFTYPLRCLRVPPGVRVPQVEYHCFRGDGCC